MDMDDPKIGGCIFAAEKGVKIDVFDAGIESQFENKDGGVVLRLEYSPEVLAIHLNAAETARLAVVLGNVMSSPRQQLIALIGDFLRRVLTLKDKHVLRYGDKTNIRKALLLLKGD